MAMQRVTSFAAATNVSSVPGRVSAIHVLRADAPGADTFVSVYDSAAPSLGTTVPEFEARIPQEAQAGKARMQKIVLPGGGIRFTTAISVAVTTGFHGATGATTTAPQAVDVFWEVGG